MKPEVEKLNDWKKAVLFFLVHLIKLFELIAFNIKNKTNKNILIAFNIH